MKRVITVIASLLLAGVAYAQPGGFGGGMPMMPMGGMGMMGGNTFEIQENIKKTVDSLTIVLDLDKKQAKKMKKALEYDYNNDMMSTISSFISMMGISSPLGENEEAEKARKDREERYAKFLTPEQFDKWKANEEETARRAGEEAQRMMEQFRQNMPEGGFPGGGPGGFPGGGFPGGGFPGGGFPGGGRPF